MTNSDGAPRNSREKRKSAMFNLDDSVFSNVTFNVSRLISYWSKTMHIWEQNNTQNKTKTETKHESTIKKKKNGHRQRPIVSSMQKTVRHDCRESSSERDQRNGNNSESNAKACRLKSNAKCTWLMFYWPSTRTQRNRIVCVTIHAVCELTSHRTKQKKSLSNIESSRVWLLWIEDKYCHDPNIVMVSECRICSMSHSHL